MRRATRPACRSVRRRHRPRLVGVGEQAGISAAAADELPHLRRPPGASPAFQRDGYRLYRMGRGVDTLPAD